MGTGLKKQGHNEAKKMPKLLLLQSMLAYKLQTSWLVFTVKCYHNANEQGQYLRLVRHILGRLQYKNATSNSVTEFKTKNILQMKKTFTDAICGAFCVLTAG